jgi:hypothetical protein
LANATDAIAFHVQNLHDHGDPIPLPRTLDDVRGDPEFTDDFENHAAVALIPYAPPGKTVRINITLDEHLLAAIDRAASERGSTRSGPLAEAARRDLMGQ